MKTFVIYNRETADIVNSSFFSDKKGFSIDDICEVQALNVGETTIVGIDDAIVTRVWDEE